MNSDNMTATEKVIEYFKCKVLEGEWNVGDRLPDVYKRQAKARV